MNSLINGMIVVFALAVAGLCFAGIMSVEQATAQNVQAAYVSLHAGGR